MHRIFERSSNLTQVPVSLPVFESTPASLRGLYGCALYCFHFCPYLQEAIVTRSASVSTASSPREAAHVWSARYSRDRAACWPLATVVVGCHPAIQTSTIGRSPWLPYEVVLLDSKSHKQPRLRSDAEAFVSTHNRDSHNQRPDDRTHAQGPYIIHVQWCSLKWTPPAA